VIRARPLRRYDLLQLTSNLDTKKTKQLLLSWKESEDRCNLIYSSMIKEFHRIFFRFTLSELKLTIPSCYRLEQSQACKILRGHGHRDSKKFRMESP
jgi:hypothetical protein